MTLGTLVVGLGQIGMGYDLHLESTNRIYTHCRAFSQHPAFHLMGGVDPDAQRRQVFQQNYRCSTYADVDASLCQQEPDLVVIASPTRFHGDILRRVLSQSQPKVVLCEKPLSLDVEEARTMVQDCSAQGVSLYVNYMRRSDPGVIEIKRRLAAGPIETPIKGVAWYSKGFQHNGSHFFNLLEYWLGSMESAQVLASGRLFEDADPEPDVRVGFRRGSIVFLAAREEAFSHYTIELVASNGRLRYEQGGQQIVWQAARPDPTFRGYTVLSAEPETIASGMELYQWHVAEQLAAAFDGREYYLCSGAEALATLFSIQRIIDDYENDD